MATEIHINKNQEKALKTIISSGKAFIGTDVDGRATNALVARGLAKKGENKQGVFATETAKGKKFLN